MERAVGKSVSELQTPDEIAAAFGLWPSYATAYAPELLHWFWRKGRLGKEVLRRIIPADEALRRQEEEALAKLPSSIAIVKGEPISSDLPLLLYVWRYTDFPTAGCPARSWRAMFRAAGFLSDGIANPTRRRILYRACTREGRRGMSWTSERWIAEDFADKWFELSLSQKRGHVYRTVAGPEHVLAAIHGRLFRPEREFIIDAGSLPISLVETAKARVARLETEEARAGRRFQRLVSAPGAGTLNCPKTVP